MENTWIKFEIIPYKKIEKRERKINKNHLRRQEWVRKADFEDEFEYEYESAFFRNSDHWWGSEVLDELLEIQTPVITAEARFLL